MSQHSDSIDTICGLLKSTLSSSTAHGYVIGLSGGVDSALAASLCCKAAGPENVLGLFLPSDLTPAEDEDDVRSLCTGLGMRWIKVPIGHVIDQYKKIPDFLETPYLLGNMMARTRMVILYYYANRTSCLVCGTSNRTEYLIGYCTKFGDNAADIQPLLHLQKDEVYELARIAGVPESILTRPPSAGLWRNQTDEAEIGLTYREIDDAIRSLEQHNWIPETEVQKKVIRKIESGKHKRSGASHL